MYTFFASLYLLLSSGFALSLHYCHGELTEVNFTESTCCCPPSHNEENSGCCTNQEIVLLADLEEQSITSPVQVVPVFAGIYHAMTQLTEPTEQIKEGDPIWSFSDFSPPPKVYLEHFPLVLYS